MLQSTPAMLSEVENELRFGGSGTGAAASSGDCSDLESRAGYAIRAAERAYFAPDNEVSEQCDRDPNGHMASQPASGFEWSQHAELWKGALAKLAADRELIRAGDTPPELRGVLFFVPPVMRGGEPLMVAAIQRTKDGFAGLVEVRGNLVEALRVTRTACGKFPQRSADLTSSMRREVRHCCREGDVSALCALERDVCVRDPSAIERHRTLHRRSALLHDMIRSCAKGRCEAPEDSPFRRGEHVQDLEASGLAVPGGKAVPSTMMHWASLAAAYDEMLRLNDARFRRAWLSGANAGCRL